MKFSDALFDVAVIVVLLIIMASVVGIHQRLDFHDDELDQTRVEREQTRLHNLSHEENEP